MIINYEPHKTLLIQLIENGVDYILIGGVAVNFHGYNRVTLDMDIWVRPTNANRDKLMQMLRKRGYSNDELKDIVNKDFTKPFMFFIGQKPTRIDFLTHISLVSFDDAFEQRKFFEMSGYQIPVLHLHHLVLSKFTTSRPKDKRDLEELQRIMRNENKK